jgi:hypothetical protein
VRKEFVAHGEDSFWAFFPEQREQLPCREPQQQQPGQQQQQHRVSLCPQLRPTAPDGTATSMELNRPPPRSRLATGLDKTTSRPSGASSVRGCPVERTGRANVSREALWSAVPGHRFHGRQRPHNPPLLFLGQTSLKSGVKPPHSQAGCAREIPQQYL